MWTCGRASATVPRKQLQPLSARYNLPKKKGGKKHRCHTSTGNSDNTAACFTPPHFGGRTLLAAIAVCIDLKDKIPPAPSAA